MIGLTFRELSMRANHDRVQGVSLVELSIVLVIIGLIAGGVLVGQSLIQHAEIRSVEKDLAEFRAATNTFREKFNCIPGDCVNVASYVTGATNGDGDGKIEDPAAASSTGECFGAWQQLALLGLIAGQYTGTSGPSGATHSLIGTNIPASRVQGAGYSWREWTTVSGHADMYDGYFGNLLYLGKESTTGTTTKAALAPADAYGLDKKIDDDIPGTGNIRTFHQSSTSNPNCALGNGNQATTSSYNLTYTGGAACTLIIIFQDL